MVHDHQRRALPALGGVLRRRAEPRVQHAEQVLPIPRETFNVVIYSFLGFFKIVYLVFVVVPFVALLIVG